MNTKAEITFSTPVGNFIVDPTSKKIVHLLVKEDCSFGNSGTLLVNEIVFEARVEKDGEIFWGYTFACYLDENLVTKIDGIYSLLLDPDKIVVYGKGGGLPL